jgi:hypothetical protein
VRTNESQPNNPTKTPFVGSFKALFRFITRDTLKERAMLLSCLDSKALFRFIKRDKLDIPPSLCVSHSVDRSGKRSRQALQSQERVSGDEMVKGKMQKLFVV